MFTRISKSAARKVFENGGVLYVCPVKFRPEFSARFTFFGLDSGKEMWASFDAFVNAFSYYNCNNETGRYPAYYIHD